MPEYLSSPIRTYNVLCGEKVLRTAMNFSKTHHIRLGLVGIEPTIRNISCFEPLSSPQQRSNTFHLEEVEEQPSDSSTNPMYFQRTVSLELTSQSQYIANIRIIPETSKYFTTFFAIILRIEVINHRIA